MIKLQIKDSTKEEIPKNTDCIVLDYPYFTEEEFEKIKEKEKGGKSSMRKEKELFVHYNQAEEVINRSHEYSEVTGAWLIFFSAGNYRWKTIFFNKTRQEYTVNWVRQKGGLGGTIRRNTEYITVVNHYSREKIVPRGCIDESIIIFKNFNDTKLRPCIKPLKLWEELFLWLGVKNVYDPFAGWGNGAIVAKKIGINFIGYDKDPRLQKRYDEILQKKVLEEFLTSEKNE